MRRMMTIALFAAALAACGGSPSAAPTPSPASTSAPTATKLAATSAPETDAAAPTSAPETDAAAPDFSDIAKGLDKLSSYRSIFRYKLEGTTAAGAAQTSEIQLDQRVVTASKQSLTEMTMRGVESAAGTAVTIATIDGTSYIISRIDGKRSCVSSSADGSDAMVTTPEAMVGGVKGAKLAARGETVNGVLTDRYTYDEQRGAIAGYANARGEVWLAQDAGYLVKYTGTADVKDAQVAGDITIAQGAVTWSYEISEIDQVETIAVPPECIGQGAGAKGSYPVVDGATKVVSVGELLTYNTSMTVDQLKAYYQQQMVAAGWVPGEATDGNQMWMSGFSKDGKRINVVVSTNADDRTVSIVPAQ